MDTPNPNHVDPAPIIEEKEEEVNEVLTLEDKYNKILETSSFGGCGLYQVLTTSAVILGMIGQGFLDYNMAYLIIMPEFTCTDSGDACTNDDICQGQNTPQQPYTINFGNSTNLHNWVEQYDLVCAGKLELALFA